MGNMTSSCQATGYEFPPASLQELIPQNPYAMGTVMALVLAVKVLRLSLCSRLNTPQGHDKYNFISNKSDRMSTLHYTVKSSHSRQHNTSDLVWPDVFEMLAEHFGLRLA